MLVQMINPAVSFLNEWNGMTGTSGPLVASGDGLDRAIVAKLVRS